MRIYEKLGVPEGLNSMASLLFKKIKKDIKSKIEKEDLSNNGESKSIEIGTYDIYIDDLVLYDFPVFLKIHYTDVFYGVSLLGAGVSVPSKPESYNDKIFLKNINAATDDDAINELHINLVIGEKQSNLFKGSYEYQVIECISNELNTGIIAHELKHLYDHFKSEKSSITTRIEYNSYQIGGLPKIASNFLHLLYYTTSVENLVRPSELYQSMIDNEIDKYSFREFMQNHEMIKTLKNAENFSLSEFKEKLNNDKDVIELVHSAYEDDYQSIGSIADDFLNILFINISSTALDSLENILGNFVLSNSSIFDMIFGSENDYQRIAEKNFKSILNSYSKYKNNPQKYFEFLEKRIKFAGKEMIKKLYKLYDMLEENKDVKSITNWELHNKISSKNEKLIYTLDFETFKILKKK